MFWVFTRLILGLIFVITKTQNMKVSILDYSFRSNEQVIIFNTEEAKPSGNVYQFSPTPAQVIDMGIALKVVDADDYDDGKNGQQLRVGVDVFGTDKIRYFSYDETIDCISGESLELIALRLAQKHFKEIQSENKLLGQLI